LIIYLALFAAPVEFMTKVNGEKLGSLVAEILQT